MTEAEKVHRHTAFQKRAQAAVKRAMQDLLRPTAVRDISFNAFGPPAEPWEGAGNAPEC